MLLHLFTDFFLYQQIHFEVSVQLHVLISVWGKTSNTHNKDLQHFSPLVVFFSLPFFSNSCKQLLIK